MSSETTVTCIHGHFNHVVLPVIYNIELTTVCLHIYYLISASSLQNIYVRHIPPQPATRDCEHSLFGIRG